MKGIVLHGGAGTRLRPLTHTGPKQLIPIANKPVSQYAVEDLIDCKISQIAFVLGDTHPNRVREYYGDGSRFHVKFQYVPQGEPRGIAHAVGLCQGFVGNDSFIVYLGDNLIKGGIAKYAGEFQKTGADAMILLSKVKDPTRFGVASFDDKGKLAALVEKPKKPPSNFALTGIYMFKPVIFDMIKKLKPSWRNELEITEAIQMLLQEGGKINHHVVEGWWKDTGTPEDILESNRLVLDELKPKIDGDVEGDASVQGRVAVGIGSKVSAKARVRGPSIIGENSMIEPGVYIGPYTSIGNHVTVRRGEIEDSIIMDHCQIDAPLRITNSIIGQHTTIRDGGEHAPKGISLTLGENCVLNL